ncbi:hypothetical protein MBLNU230_g3926t1 [Neophaeotheca triangularis]
MPPKRAPAAAAAPTTRKTRASSRASAEPLVAGLDDNIGRRTRSRATARVPSAVAEEPEEDKEQETAIFLNAQYKPESVIDNGIVPFVPATRARKPKPAPARKVAKKAKAPPRPFNAHTELNELWAIRHNQNDVDAFRARMAQLTNDQVIAVLDMSLQARADEERRYQREIAEETAQKEAAINYMQQRPLLHRASIVSSFPTPLPVERPASSTEEAARARAVKKPPQTPIQPAEAETTMMGTMMSDFPSDLPQATPMMAQTRNRASVPDFRAPSPGSDSSSGSTVQQETATAQPEASAQQASTTQVQTPNDVTNAVQAAPPTPAGRLSGVFSWLSSPFKRTATPRPASTQAVATAAPTNNIQAPTTSTAPPTTSDQAPPTTTRQNKRRRVEDVEEPEQPSTKRARPTTSTHTDTPTRGPREEQRKRLRVEEPEETQEPSTKRARHNTSDVPDTPTRKPREHGDWHASHPTFNCPSVKYRNKVDTSLSTINEQSEMTPAANEQTVPPNSVARRRTIKMARAAYAPYPAPSPRTGLDKLRELRHAQRQVAALEKDEDLSDFLKPVKRTKYVKVDRLVKIPHNRPGESSGTFRVPDLDDDDEMEVWEDVAERSENIFSSPAPAQASTATASANDVTTDTNTATDGPPEYFDPTTSTCTAWGPIVGKKPTGGNKWGFPDCGPKKGPDYVEWSAEYRRKCGEHVGNLYQQWIAENPWALDVNNAREHNEWVASQRSKGLGHGHKEYNEWQAQKQRDANMNQD